MSSGRIAHPPSRADDEAAADVEAAYVDTGDGADVHSE